MTLLLGVGTALTLLAIPVIFFSFREDSPLMLVPADPEREKCENPTQLWLYDSLKMRGFVVAAKVPCGPYEIDLALLSHKIAVYCEPPTTAGKVFDQRKKRYLRQNGWRTIDIRPQNLYRDFQQNLRKIDVYRQN
ncbi:MAG TPA: hypothetical protein VFT51_06665 [Bacillales bacterium]|nr:hypothetical protein [Bacillales bacterium]